MRLNKQELFLITGLIVVAIVFVVVILFSLTKSGSLRSLNMTLFPTPTIVQVNNSSQSQTNEQPDITPLVKYNEASQRKINENLLHTPSLAVSDATVKNKILSLLSGGAGNVYLTQNVTVSYLPAIKEFQGEIKTTNIDLAKKEVVDWFKNQGMSQQGICNLPLEFFLNWDVMHNPSIKNLVFDALPPGC